MPYCESCDGFLLTVFSGDTQSFSCSKCLKITQPSDDDTMMKCMILNDETTTNFSLGNDTMRHAVSCCLPTHGGAVKCSPAWKIAVLNPGNSAHCIASRARACDDHLLCRQPLMTRAVNLPLVLAVKQLRYAVHWMSHRCPFRATEPFWPP